MTPNSGALPTLLALGAGWGLSIPLSKIAVDGGLQPLGLIFWQVLIGTILLGAIIYARGGKFHFEPRHVKLYLLIAVLGTIVPNTAGYTAAKHLPAGVLAITISMVPMFAFPIALWFGLDKFQWRRFLGLIVGLVAVALLVLPEASLPTRAAAVFIPLAMIGPFCYGIEGNYVSKFGTEGLDPMQTLFGASLIGVVLSAPLALGMGHWVNPIASFGAAEAAMVGSSVIHALVYSGYVWLVGRAGSVFAAQVSYIVTITGVGWAMLLLGEAYSPYIWVTLVLMLLGMFLVQPRDKEALA